MPRISAGLLLYRHHPTGLQFLLAHPGGPFWKNKDQGVWTIPKGEVNPNEDLLDTAKREFTEEIGFTPTGDFLPLNPITQKSGKIVHAWAIESDFDTTTIQSNTCSIEWPPKSGKQMEIPEVDRAEFFDLATARMKINPAQVGLIEELVARFNQ